MRWTSSIKIDSLEDFNQVIKCLNYEWYLSKKKFFLQERFYNQSIDKIIIDWGRQLEDYQDEITGESVEVLVFHNVNEYTFFEYCWNSKIEGLLAYNNIEVIDDIPSKKHDLPFPIDVKEVYEVLLKYIDVTFKIITQLEYKVKIINEIINLINENLFISNTNDNAFEVIIHTLRDKIIDGIKKGHNNILNLHYKFVDKPIAIESNTTKKPLPISSTIIIGFNYVNSYTKPESIKDVFNSLLKADLIDPATKLTDFRKIFCNTAVQKKIVWTGKLAELAFFIKSLKKSSQFLFEKEDVNWKTCIDCFQLSKSRHLNKDKLRQSKPPAIGSCQRIETIVNHFE